MRCYFEGLLPHEAGTSARYVGRKDDQPVFECSSCGLVFSPKGDYAEYLKIYQEPGMYFQTSVSVGYSSFEERFQHDYAVSEVRVKNLLWQVGGSSNRRSVLDVGCGNCALLKRLLVEGFQAWGLDLDAWSVCKGQLLAGHPAVLVKDFLDLQEVEPQDILLFTDSFEHLLYPQSAAEKAEGLVREGGWIVIEMPDAECDAWRAERLGWRHVKPKEHPFLYSRHHVLALFRSCVLVDVIYTIPGRAVYYLRRCADAPSAS